MYLLKSYEMPRPFLQIGVGLPVRQPDAGGGTVVISEHECFDDSKQGQGERLG